MAYINGRKVLQVVKTTAAPASYQTKTITPSNFTPIVLPDVGYQALSKVIINGILVDPHYDYLTITDADLAYTKTIPVGALPNGVLNAFGGITYKLNQLLPQRTVFTNNGITITPLDNGKYHIEGTATAATYFSIYSQYVFWGNEHKCMLIDNVKTTGNYLSFDFYNGDTFVTGTGSKSNGQIITTPANQYTRVFAYIFFNEGDTVNYDFQPQLFDLTTTGINTTDADIAKAELLKRGINTNVYNPYNAGSLRYNEPKAIDIRGFNLWDEQWEQGSYNTTTGVKQGGARLRCKNQIAVDPNTTYFLSVGTLSGGVFFFYDKNGNYINSTNVNRNSTFTTPSNATYMAFNMFSEYGDGTTYNNDICINVSNASLNGQYKTSVHNNLYADEIAAIRHYIVDDLGYDEDVLGYGIDKDNCNYIDFENKKVVIKYARVDLGTLSWSRNLFDSVYAFSCTINDLSQVRGSKIICPLYNDKGIIAIADMLNLDMTNFGDTRIFIRNDSYTDTAAFKAAMAGVYLVYELATPIEIDISDLLESALIQPLEAGGVITLENDYDAAIPSSITYLVEE